MSIHVLPPEVAAKIAAGEVIERPASVVKELIENAIDAGATGIDVRVQRGGRQLIRVADDGCGIPAAEAPLAFARHATSKLRTVDDLARITTLGFRGEALASIAAVARVTLLTRTADEESGTRLRVEGGRVVRHEQCGHPQGTTVIVENLFYNVPARLKFLRSEATERRHIDDLVTRYAMAYPHLRFSLHHDDRPVFRSPGSGSLYDVLIEVYGLQVAQLMVAIGGDVGGSIRVSGYISLPELHRANRQHITLFVNGRWVRDRGLSVAVEQAYHTLLPLNRHPLAVVQVSLPPEEVDVNVHPTKSEVKFRRHDEVFRAVQRSVRSTLLARSPIPEARPVEREWGGEGQPVGGAELEWMDLSPPAEMSQPSLPGAPSESLPPLRVLGQLAQTYIIAEGPEGMYLIDQHAAHERVLYEELLARQAAADVQVQRLLQPLPIELTPAQAEELESWLHPLRRLGFEVEPFGGNTVLLRALPAFLTGADARQTLVGILDELAAGEEPLAGEVEAHLAAIACKRGAVKAGQTLSLEEMQALIAALERTTSPRTCPHGRPTMITLSRTWLEHEFGRR